MAENQAERTLRAYLDCGISACGFARTRCDKSGRKRPSEQAAT